jgi:hypothetical protein
LRGEARTEEPKLRRAREATMTERIAKELGEVKERSESECVKEREGREVEEGKRQRGPISGSRGPLVHGVGKRSSICCDEVGLGTLKQTTS